MKCPACDHENRAGAKFCEACAAPLRSLWASCGAALRPTAKFCDECGASVSAALLAEIYGWFTEGFDTKDVQDAKALLEGVDL